MISMVVEGVPDVTRRLEYRRYELILADLVREVTEFVAKGERASAPRATGNLVRSISGEARGLQGEVQVTAFYGRFVEFGTVKMRPRRFVRPTLTSARGHLRRAAQVVGERIVRAFQR